MAVAGLVVDGATADDFVLELPVCAGPPVLLPEATEELRGALSIVIVSASSFCLPLLAPTGRCEPPVDESVATVGVDGSTGAIRGFGFGLGLLSFGACP